MKFIGLRKNHLLLPSGNTGFRRLDNMLNIYRYKDLLIKILAAGIDYY